MVVKSVAAAALIAVTSTAASPIWKEASGELLMYIIAARNDILIIQRQLNVLISEISDLETLAILGASEVKAQA
jgi:hypothetical protein